MSEVKKNTILSLKDISISFSRNYKKDGVEFSESRFVLKNISLELFEGEIVALMGGNGSGKTTLFNIISGLLEPNNGKIIFNGEDITKWKAHERAKPVIGESAKSGIGRLFQDNHIFHNISVLENLCLASDNPFGENPFNSLLSKKKMKDQEKARITNAKKYLSEIFEGQSDSLLGKLNKLAGELSYGEKRLLGLARIFMGNYKLVLLDEPSAGINDSLTNNILEMIKKLRNENITVFLIEHEKQFIDNIASRVIHLKNDGSHYNF